MVTKMTDDELQAAARRTSMLQTAALVVLLERNGGSLTFTEAEYQAIVDRYGGSRLMAIHHEVLRSSAGDEVRFTLVRKEPGQGELVS
jgi:hypothetical protein